MLKSNSFQHRPTYHRLSVAKITSYYLKRIRSRVSASSKLGDSTHRFSRVSVTHHDCFGKKTVAANLLGHLRSPNFALPLMLSAALSLMI